MIFLDARTFLHIGSHFTWSFTWRISCFLKFSCFFLTAFLYVHQEMVLVCICWCLRPQLAKSGRFPISPRQLTTFLLLFFLTVPLCSSNSAVCRIVVHYAHDFSRIVQEANDNDGGTVNCAFSFHPWGSSVSLLFLFISDCLSRGE